MQSPEDSKKEDSSEEDDLMFMLMMSEPEVGFDELLDMGVAMYHMGY